MTECTQIVIRTHSIRHRHKTNVGILAEMLPDDILMYCKQHHLLEPMLGSAVGEVAKTSAASNDYQDPYPELAATPPS